MTSLKTKLIVCGTKENYKKRMFSKFRKVRAFLKSISGSKFQHQNSRHVREIPNVWQP